jgi:hypothetical protein
MPANLPPEEFARLATLMHRLHADFRERHGLPPVRNPWSRLDDIDSLKRRLAVNDPGVLDSPRRPVTGPIIERVRWVLWRILKPVFDRQTEVNRDLLALSMESLTQDLDRYAIRNEQRVLANQVADVRLASSPPARRDS